MNHQREEITKNVDTTIVFLYTVDVWGKNSPGAFDDFVSPAFHLDFATRQIALQLYYHKYIENSILSL